MRFSAPCLRLLFVISLVVISVASGGVPVTRATARAGEIVLTPTHAVPGTLVSFQGVGWDLPVEVGGEQPTPTVCRIDGAPVTMGRYSICNVIRVSGIGEPVGTFVVANVSAGTYKISISVDIPTHVSPLVGSWDFTIDTATAPIPEFPLPILTLAVALVITSLVSTRRRKRP